MHLHHISGQVCTTLVCKSRKMSAKISAFLEFIRLVHIAASGDGAVKVDDPQVFSRRYGQHRPSRTQSHAWIETRTHASVPPCSGLFVRRSETSAERFSRSSRAITTGGLLQNTAEASSVASCNKN